MIHHITRFTQRLLFWSLVFFAIGISIVRLLASGIGIDGYKTDLEHKLFELTSIPVEIGLLRANMRGVNPEAVLKNIKIVTSENQKQQPVQLDEVRVGLDLGKLLLTQKLLPSSRLTLVGAKLSIIRKKDGRISVVGLGGSNSKQPLWLLSGGQYEVLKSEITWIDKLRDAAPVTFKNVDLLIKNKRKNRSHELHLVSQLPKGYGKKLRVSLEIEGDVVTMDKLKGKVYVEASDVYFSEYLKEFLPANLNITDGKEKAVGNIKLWSHWKNSKIEGLSGNMQVANAVLKKQKKIINIKSFSTEFISNNRKEGWRLGVNYLDLVTKKQVWPTAQFSLSSNKEQTYLSSFITRLDLRELSMFVDFFAPLDKEKQTLVSKLDLKGALKDFSFDVNLNNNKAKINGAFKSVYVNAYAKVPQIRNFTGSVHGNNTQGSISLNTKNGALLFPKLLRKPIKADDLRGQIEWQQKPNKWKIETKSLVLNTKDIHTHTRLLLTIPKTDKSPFIDLQTSFSNVTDVSSLKAYYPAGMMKKKTLKWLDEAFVSGQIKKGGILIYGELAKFPFLKGEGVYEALFDATDVEFNFSQDWPNVTHGQAEILFLKNGVSIDIKQAEIEHLKITQASVEIPSFKKSKHMFIKGEVKGEIPHALSFLQHTPINKGVDGFVNAIESKGDTHVKLDLKVPLKPKAGANAVAEIKGQAHFNNAELTVKALGLNVNELTGDLFVTEKGLFSDNLIGKTLGYPVSAKIGHDEAKTVVNIDGKTDSAALKTQFSFLNYEFLKDNSVSGSTPYNITIDLPKDENSTPEINLKSTLIGMPIDLPESLKKTAEEEKNLLMKMVLNKEGLLPLNIKYDNALKAALHINKQQNALHSAQIVYGQSDAQAPNTRGVDVRVKRDVFNASEWRSFLKQPFSSEKESAIKLNLVILKTDRLLWNTHDFGAAELGLLRTEQQWNGDLVSSFAKGHFIIPHIQTETDKIKFTMEKIDLSRLSNLNQQEDDSAEETIPVVDISSKELWLKNINLGSLEIETEKIVNGVQFKRIDVTSDKLNIKLKGDWIKSDKRSSTILYGDIKATDLGSTLSQLNMTKDLKETHGKVNLGASWPGLPYQFSLQTVGAKVGLVLEKGRVSSIEPGFGRLLGLIAIDQWVKRLTFDYSDLYKKGLSFNKIKGNFKINKGTMKTENLLVDAIPARIFINGEMDLLTKTLNHKVKVVPKSSDAIPIAGTIVGEIAGALTQAIDKDYEEGYFFGSKYSVTGKWNDIKVTPIK